ncbi:MAG: hypothetical protein RBU30_26030, partial [Polyangia bacterium]|nr:hypothetical protein [Polyangia bacterium]
TILVAVEKGPELVLAADTKTSFDMHTQPIENLRAEKIMEAGEAVLGCAGWALYGNLLEDYLRDKKKIALGSRQEVFRFFLKFWEDLREHYSFVEDRAADEDTPFADLDSEFLIVHPGGIFHVASHLTVSRIQRFFAIGAGADYALGALQVLYHQEFDAEALARKAVETAMAFCSDCGGPVDLRKLAR